MQARIAYVVGRKISFRAAKELKEAVWAPQVRNSGRASAHRGSRRMVSRGEVAIAGAQRANKLLAQWVNEFGRISLL